MYTIVLTTCRLQIKTHVRACVRTISQILSDPCLNQHQQKKKNKKKRSKGISICCWKAPAVRCISSCATNEAKLNSIDFNTAAEELFLTLRFRSGCWRFFFLLKHNFDLHVYQCTKRIVVLNNNYGKSCKKTATTTSDTFVVRNR